VRAGLPEAAPYGHPPALSALAADPASEDDDRTVTVTLEDVTTWYALVRVWRTRPRRGRGVTAPAGKGVRLHVTAFGISAGTEGQARGATG
jgi:hypothetical protein